jgi:hypothetical protein
MTKYITTTAYDVSAYAQFEVEADTLEDAIALITEQINDEVHETNYETSDSARIVFIKDSAGKELAHSISLDPYAPVYLWPEDKALLKAAPALLKALKDVVNCRTIPNKGPLNMWTAAREAIAEAEKE